MSQPTLSPIVTAASEGDLDWRKSSLRARPDVTPAFGNGRTALYFSQNKPYILQVPNWIQDADISAKDEDRNSLSHDNFPALHVVIQVQAARVLGRIPARSRERSFGSSGNGTDGGEMINGLKYLY